MGLCNFPLGAYYAVMLLTLPQLLTANSVPQQQIAYTTAVGLVPSFCSFLLSPLIDWRFRRRTYAIVFAGMAALMAFSALTFIRELGLLTVFLFFGSASVTLYYAAIGGWLGGLVGSEDKSRLGAWFTVANFGGGGFTAVIAIILLRELPFQLGAIILSLLLLAPLPVLAFLPAPPADRRLASDSFREFFREVLALLGRRTVLWTLLLFAMPAASFALTNQLSGLGRDFGASEQLVGIVAGAGVSMAGIVGSLIVPRLIREFRPLHLYLLIGSVGCLFTLMLIGLPRTPAIFALAVLGENAFQSAAFAVESTIILRGIGNNNPLAATQYALLAAAPTFPIAYMQAVDGTAYAGGGLSGSFLADGFVGLVACAILASLFWLVRRQSEEISPS